jgi:hypothetical protein
MSELVDFEKHIEQVNTEQQTKWKEIVERKVPQWALSDVPGAGKLTSIKSIYITETLNEMFGIGGWNLQTELVPINGNTFIVTKKSDTSFYTVMAKVVFQVPNEGIHYECIASSDNTDLGNASKGAISDCIGKIGSWLGIAAAVYRGESLYENLNASHPEWKAIKEKFKAGDITLEQIKESYKMDAASITMLQR